MRASSLRRGSFVVSLGVVATLVLSATSCAQVLGINKDYKKGVLVPAGWYCPTSQYDEIGSGADPADAYCDCVCGAYDPDCDEDFDGDIKAVSDHTDPALDPDGDVGSARCKVCLEDDSAEGSVCAEAR